MRELISKDPFKLSAALFTALFAIMFTVVISGESVAFADEPVSDGALTAGEFSTDEDSAQPKLSAQKSKIKVSDITLIDLNGKKSTLYDSYLGKEYVVIAGRYG